MKNRQLKLHNEIDEMLETVEQASIAHAIIDHERKLVIPTNSKINYDNTRVPGISAFVDCADNQNIKGKIVVGAFGTGKTSKIIQRILYDACTMPACADSIIRSRWAFIRSTLSRLETTTLDAWLYWTQFLPTPIRSKLPTWKYQYSFRVQDGYEINDVEINIILLPLDHINNIDKLASLELTGGYINEVREIPKLVLDTLLARINRYPAKDNFLHMYKGDMTDYGDWFPYHGCVYCDTNAPEEDHWIAKLDAKKDKLKSIAIYHQPPGCVKNKDGEWINNKQADNIISHHPNYYTDYLDQGDEFFNVYALGEYGSVNKGLTIYPQFRESLHVADNLWNKVEDELFYFGWDFGLTPCWLLGQRLKSGQLIILHEIVTDEGQRGIEEMVEYDVLPYINTTINGKPYKSIADPSGLVGNQNNNMSNISVIRKAGIKTVGALSNVATIRQNCTKSYLNKLINGEAAVQIDRSCVTLIKALKSKYCWKRVGVVGKEEFKNVPDKIHPYSDIVDCFEYIIVDFTYTKKSDETDKINLRMRNVL